MLFFLMIYVENFIWSVPDARDVPKYIIPKSIFRCGKKKPHLLLFLINRPDELVDAGNLLVAGESWLECERVLGWRRAEE
jgi:hypothetical protein